MQYEIFQHIQLAVQRPITGPYSKSDKADQFTIKEKVILYPFLAILLCLLIISAWSAVLLATGNTESGGPIGIAARLLFDITW